MFVKLFCLISLIMKIHATENSGCNSPKLQTGVQGSFHSMNYPDNYKPFAKCSWLITVPASQKIVIEFEVDFSIEKGNVKKKCFDFVELYEGSNSNGQKIGIYCGKVVPHKIVSKSNQVFVKFESDDNFQAMGFGIQWKAIDSTSRDPNLFTWNGDEYYHGITESTWQEARDTCRSIWGPGNGDLVTIDDAEENDYLFEKCYSPHKAWIGANDIQSEGNFVWSDNSPLQFSQWNVKEPNNLNNEDCVHLVKDSYGDGKWNDAPCSRKLWFICERTKPIINQVSPNFFKWNGSEYYRGTTESSWKEARDTCREIWGQQNGDLVTINSAEENHAVFILAKRANKYMAWIGANDIMKEGEFVWADNSPMLFSNWKLGEPNNIKDEDCVHYIGRGGGIWNDVNCRTKMWFVCERKS